jgi:CRP-like cAMP-binding protein/signal recognition particle receptor subunit beta
MPIFNYKVKEVIAKIVYYGPGLCGKTTSLQHIHQQAIPEQKGELYFLATETDQTIYFELLPLHVGEIKDFKLRFQVYTVPGQVKYNNTRKAVLQGVDAIVFVADSQRSRRKANLISFENLKYNLKGGYNVLLENIPLVYEYNKRDMGDILTVAELSRDLNLRNLPYFETIATESKGVLEAFEAISSLAIESLEKRLFQLEAQKSPAVFREVQKKITQSLNIATQRDVSRGHQTIFSENARQTDSLEVSDSVQPPGSLERSEALPLLEDEKELDGLLLPEDEHESEVLPLSVAAEEDKSLSYLDLFAVTYHDGETIFEEGDIGNEMYFIEEGRVRIVGSYKLTKKVLAIYEKGDFFGEMILFGGKTRSATAVAIGTTQLLPVTKDTLASQIQNRPEIAIALLETLSNRIRNDVQTIGKLADHNKELRQRLIDTRDTMKQIIEQNKLLKQKLGLAQA